MGKSVGFYDHHKGYATFPVAKTFRERGITVSTGDCLCNYPHEQLPDIVVINPLYAPGSCWEKVRSSIENHPSTRFYVLIASLIRGTSEEVRSGIGSHPNLIYMVAPSGNGNDYNETMQSLLEELAAER